MYGIPAAHDSPGEKLPALRSQPLLELAARVLQARGWLGAVGAPGPTAAGARQQHPPSRHGRPAGSSARAGGRQEREGAKNGKNWRKCLFTPWSIPEEGQGTAQAPWGGSCNLPPCHPSHGLPVSSQRGMQAPNWDPGRWLPPGVRGVPSAWLSSSPTCFLGWLLRTRLGSP